MTDYEENYTKARQKVYNCGEWGDPPEAMHNAGIAAVVAAAKAEALDLNAVESALRALISDIDYDIHKFIECDEITGEDGYPDLTDEFIRLYTKARDIK